MLSKFERSETFYFFKSFKLLSFTVLSMILHATVLPSRTMDTENKFSLEMIYVM